MANRLQEFNFEFGIDVVYNKAAFEKTINHIQETTDLLSKTQVEDILKANDFIKIKTYGMLTNRYIDFKIEYTEQFIKTVISSN